MDTIKVHNLQFHINDALYYALLRKKLEFCQAGYNCKSWKQFLYIISQLPVLTPKRIEDERRMYAIMNKLKDYKLGSSELADNLQCKAQRLYDADVNREMAELKRQKAVLEEAMQNVDLDQSDFVRYFNMLETANLAIDEIENQGQ
jgi:hypothetical protein